VAITTENSSTYIFISPPTEMEDHAATVQARLSLKHNSLYIDSTAKSRRLGLNAQIKIYNYLISLKTSNLKLNTACKNIFFAGASTYTLGL
jgi:hypothetical protein